MDDSWAGDVFIKRESDAVQFAALILQGVRYGLDRDKIESILAWDQNRTLKCAPGRSVPGDEV